jgi:long-chain acyl-CoA synthetase
VTVIAAVDPARHVAGAVTWLHRAGLGEGDRVLTLLPNSVDTLALGLACMLDGIVQVPLPHDLPAADVAEIVADAAPAAVVATAPPDLPAPVRRLAPPLDGFTSLPPTDPASDWPRTRPMAYTSGTTGRRKGVHVGVHGPDWGRTFVREESAAFDGRHGDVHLVVSPLYHSGPFRFAAITALRGGRVAVLPTFDAGTWREALRSVRPTSIFCVPTHLHRLLALPAMTGDDLASLDLLAHAGAPCPVPLKQQVLDLAPPGSVWEFYGSTEGQFTVCPPDLWRESPGTVGRARPGHRLEIRDADDNGVGTVWVRAPAEYRWEYWDAPEHTRAAWDGDAFTVGDLGRLQPHRDGPPLLHLAGRPGDLVITGGVNVYPAEVERQLLLHPDVAEAVVFGRPDPDWGERLVAAVVLWPGRHATVADLLAHARRVLPRQRVPKELHLVDDLPRTATGKVRRVALADELAAR